MSGRNVIWYALLAVVVAIGLYGLFAGSSPPQPEPVSAAESPPPARRAAPPPTRAPSATDARSPADITAEDAAKAVEALNREQNQEMMKKSALPEGMRDAAEVPAPKPE